MKKLDYLKICYQQLSYNISTILDNVNKALELPTFTIIRNVNDFYVKDKIEGCFFHINIEISTNIKMDFSCDYEDMIRLLSKLIYEMEGYYNYDKR